LKKISPDKKPLIITSNIYMQCRQLKEEGCLLSTFALSKLSTFSSMFSFSFVSSLVSWNKVLQVHKISLTTPNLETAFNMCFPFKSLSSPLTCLDPITHNLEPEHGSFFYVETTWIHNVSSQKWSIFLAQKKCLWHFCHPPTTLFWKKSGWVDGLEVQTHYRMWLDYHHAN